jgi:hypothetical protein
MEQSLYLLYFDQFGADGYGYIAQLAAADAPGKCASSMEANFRRSVLDAQEVTTQFLKAIGAPESASAQLDGLRGLDGTRDIELDTKAGPVTMHAQYDGSNGLNVVFTRTQPATD